MSLSQSCTRTVAIDSCAWVKELRPKDAIVRGSAQFQSEFGRTDLQELTEAILANRDILTPGTAGQIVALNRAVKENCTP